MPLQLDRLFSRPSQYDIDLRTVSKDAYEKFKAQAPSPGKTLQYESVTLSELLRDVSRRKPAGELRPLVDFLGDPNLVRINLVGAGKNSQNLYLGGTKDGEMGYPRIIFQFDTERFDLSRIILGHNTVLESDVPLETKRPSEALTAVLEALAGDVVGGRKRWIQDLRQSRQTFMEEASKRLGGGREALIRQLLQALAFSQPDECFVLGIFPSGENSGPIKLRTTLPVTEDRIERMRIPATPVGLDPLRFNYHRLGFKGSLSGRFEIVGVGQSEVHDPLIVLEPYNLEVVSFSGSEEHPIRNFTELDFTAFMAGRQGKRNYFGFVLRGDRDDRVTLLMANPNDCPAGPIFGE